MSSPRQILLVGGPLDGVIHELHGGLRPEAIALEDLDDPDGPLKHEYRLDPDDGSAQFVRTEKWEDDRMNLHEYMLMKARSDAAGAKDLGWALLASLGVIALGIIAYIIAGL